MAQLPIGEPPPLDGRLPASAGEGASERAFGLYLHVPYCRVRCGYCDFNTYTASELRGHSRADYAASAIAEIRLAGRVLSELTDAHPSGARPLSTVFIGGGTPTILPTADLAAMLAAARDEWGLAPNAEVTIEANPDSVDSAALAQLAAAGVTRVSFGMQSAVPHVLAALDRTHNPERIGDVVGWAREAGLRVSLDLIYGAPGERLADWQASVEAALSHAPDHISAYALIVEDGTALARRIRRGELAVPDDDLQADMYEYADARFLEAGYAWYEVSNWAKDGAQARHNLAYWTGEDWWGIGPGAHSHIGGVRWWNVKHPAAYAGRLADGHSPSYAREYVTPLMREREAVLLQTRLASGYPIAQLAKQHRAEVAALIAEGLIDGAAALAGRVVPTLRGRLLANTLVDRLTT